MTKVQEHNIKLAIKRGDIELAVRLVVMCNIESGYAGNRLQGFFVHNAEYDALSMGLSKQQFAGGLSAMKKAGKYQPSDEPGYRGNYGYLIVEQE